MSDIRVRYAPSPTGIPHIGNIRTALFNYLFAKNQDGVFVLRIEDTDRKRLVPGAVEKIKESLSLLKLDPDEEFHQSKRLEIYQKYLDELKEKDLAYEDEGAWRFKVEKGSKLTWADLVHGEISFESDVVEDFIIVKSDGYPTYHFASVVDDHDMKISHVFRGDEWISSTPKHLLLYEAFGWDSPNFVHLPPILGHDKKKLSKREGAKSVMEYIKEGYLPEALVNFMAFLGWAPKDNRELFSLSDLVSEFTIERINKNSPVFSLEKLEWFNGQWIRNTANDELSERIAVEFPQYKSSKINQIIPIVKDRITNLLDFQQLAGFLLEEEIKVDPTKIKLSSDKLEAFKKELDKVKDWSKVNITNAIASVMEQLGLSKSEALGSIGLCISGSSVTPPIYDSLEKLGKEATLKRLEDVIRKKQS